MPNVQLFQNKCGNTGLMVDGQKFRRKNKRKDGSSLWVCTRDQCSAKAVTNTDNNLVKIEQHNHILTIDTNRQSILAQASEIESPATEPEGACPVSASVDVDFVQTKREKPAILVNSYMYHHHKTLDEYTVWRCRKCCIIVRTKGDKIVSQPKPHSHEPLGEVDIDISALAQPDEKPSHLITDAMHKNNKLHYKDIRRLRRCVRKYRRKLFRRIPPNRQAPLSELAALADDDSELIRAVDSSKGTVFIARKEDISFLADKEDFTIFVDGTFKYSPDNFTQMMTVLIFNNGFYIPICHFLLQNKLFTTYRQALSMLKFECHKLGFNFASKVKNVMMDFKELLIKAERSELPGSHVQGCVFHLGQSWWRKIKELGLSPIYKDRKSAEGRWLRRCFGLPLLPASMVGPVFHAAAPPRTHSPNLDKFKDFKQLLHQ